MSLETAWDSQSSIYVLTLIACILVGTKYRTLETPLVRRKVGAGVGAVIVLLLCGKFTYHALLLVGGNMVIFKYCERRKIHQLSLAYTWLYLVYLHSLHGPRYMMWMFQSLALRMTGLAFEMYSASSARIADGKAAPSGAAPERSVETDYSLSTDLELLDVFSYAFFYVGIHRGPYYSWKIFNDHFQSRSDIRSWANYRRNATIKLLKKTAICFFCFLVLTFTVSKKLYFSPEFYSMHGSDFRFLYNVPQLVMYVLHYQLVILLCTIECCESIFAVYPARRVQVNPDEKLTSTSTWVPPTDMPLEEDNNIVYIKCYDSQKLLYGPTLIDFVKGWDIPTRYWFETHIYKTMNKAKTELRNGIYASSAASGVITNCANQAVTIFFQQYYTEFIFLRTASSFFLWFVWRGPHMSQFLLTVTLWCYCHLEREYDDLFKATGSMKVACNVGYSIMRLFCLIYITPCLVMRNNHYLIRYYCSIYWIFHWVLLVLLIAAVIAYKKNQRDMERLQRLAAAEPTAQQRE